MSAVPINSAQAVPRHDRSLVSSMLWRVLTLQVRHFLRNDFLCFPLHQQAFIQLRRGNADALAACQGSPVTTHSRCCTSRGASCERTILRSLQELNCALCVIPPLTIVLLPSEFNVREVSARCLGEMAAWEALINVSRRCLIHSEVLLPSWRACTVWLV